MAQARGKTPQEINEKPISGVRHAGRSDGGIVIVGAGLAGLFTALKLAPLPVTVVAAAPLGHGAASAWAQGGIAAAVGEGDTPEVHAGDTIAAGGGIVEPDIALGVASEAADRVGDLIALGVGFDRAPDGGFALSLEAAHSAKRIVRVSGDRVGASIMEALIAAVRRTPSIHVLEEFEAADLIVERGRVTGVRLVSLSGGRRFDLKPTRAVVLATGGVGGLYAVTTNPGFARGEGLAFAARAGAIIADAEFVQFHPTALDVGADPAPLATESIRGEGAILVNRSGSRFMPRLHPDAELAPRDIVARGVFAEIAADRGAYLDCRAIGARFAEAFPTVEGFCRSAGLDPAHNLIPVAPAAHYHMGGIATDGRGRTSLAGLWAVGEVGSTGLHGANRLASNSLLEAVVIGARAARDIAALPSIGPQQARLVSKGVLSTIARAARVNAIARLRRIMTEDIGVVRNGPGLGHALAAIAGIANDHRDDPLIANMTLAARFVAGAALLRRESRGSHFRSDFPAEDEARAHRSFLTLKDIDRLTAQCHPTREVRIGHRAHA